ncbi:MAG: chorismate mutase [Candidatus Paceibacterota bacterium]|jgi:chorismate mutase-like protein
MDLSELRNEIDQIDREFLSILSKRMKLIPKVAEYKKKNSIKRYQPEREKEVIKLRRELAKELNISSDLVESIFKEIIKDAHKIEEQIMGE